VDGQAARNRPGPDEVVEAVVLLKKTEKDAPAPAPIADLAEMRVCSKTDSRSRSDQESAYVVVPGLSGRQPKAKIPASNRANLG
jgi:hypothetical protein